jgi:hypothetical protein
LASPIATLGAALFAATFPFVVFNPFHSEFLSHRTAAFLVVALAMLVGVAAAALVRAAVHAAHVATPRPGPASSGAAPRSTPSLLLAVVPTLLVATLLAGAVYAGTPDDYPGGWYRLYTPCELDALREVARQADADPTAIVLVGDWQAKLVLAALTTDAGRVWYAGGVFASERTRGDLVATMHHNGRDLIVVVDRYLRTETPDADPSFTTAPPWQPVGSWCAATGVGQPRVTAFLAPGGAA